MHALEPEIRRELLNLYETELPSAQNKRIVDLVRIADGWETDVYSFALEYEKAAQRKRQDLILRIYPGDDALEKSAREFHMDYHPWNILLRADGAAFVIDWGNVQVSDYRLDLAWALLLMSTYGTPNVREIVLGEYERLQKVASRESSSLRW